MAGGANLLDRLRENLRSLDHAALVALANRGLVRRAQRDVLTADCHLVSEDENGIAVAVGRETVRLSSAGLATARCSCLAHSMCRHILMAALFLSEQPSESAQAANDTATKPIDELLAIDAAELERRFGKKAYRDALALLQAGSTVAIESSATVVVVRFPDKSVECRYYVGSGLAGMTATAGPRSATKFQAAAVLAYQQQHGRLLIAETEEDGIDPAILAACRSARSLLEELLDVGLSHVSPAGSERLRTHSTSARAAKAPRLARSLHSLANQVDALLARAAQADEAAIFLSLVRTHALTAAIEATKGQRRSLIGKMRGEYDDAPTLELTGVGAYRWRTAAGQIGITVLFWNESDAEFYAWADSRPEFADPSFKPERRYRQEGPWSGVANPQQASQSRLRLFNGKRTDNHRLSGTQECRASLGEPTDPATIDFKNRRYTDWNKLSEFAASVFPVGLDEPDLLRNIVVLEPAKWGERTFDEIAQVFHWRLIDASGMSIIASLSFNETNQSAIDRLESINISGDGVQAIVGAVSFEGSTLFIEPLALFRCGTERRSPILNFHFDELPPVKRRKQSLPPPNPGATSEPSEDVDPLDETAVAAEHASRICWSTATEAAVADFEHLLEELVESGRGRSTAIVDDRWTKIADRLKKRQMDLLADTVASLQQACRGSATEFPPRLIRSRYLCLLHRQAAVRRQIGRGVRR